MSVAQWQPAMPCSSSDRQGSPTHHCHAYHIRKRPKMCMPRSRSSAHGHVAGHTMSPGPVLPRGHQEGHMPNANAQAGREGKGRRGGRHMGPPPVTTTPACLTLETLAGYSLSVAGVSPHNSTVWPGVMPCPAAMPPRCKNAGTMSMLSNWCLGMLGTGKRGWGSVGGRGPTMNRLGWGRVVAVRRHGRSKARSREWERQGR